MKVGLECEGRLKGQRIRTLFVQTQEIDPLMKEIDRWLLTVGPIQQVYISDLENKLDLARDERLRELWERGLLVTVERTEVGRGIPGWVRIMLNVGLYPSVWNLRQYDQIKVAQGLDVLTVGFEEMIRTKPEDYRNDQVVQLCAE